MINGNMLPTTPAPTPAPTPPVPEQCTVMADSDCSGEDLANSGGASAADCCDQCASMPGCKAVTWVASWKSCWFKSGCDSVVSSAGRTALINTNPLPPTPAPTP